MRSGSPGIASQLFLRELGTHLEVLSHPPHRMILLHIASVSEVYLPEPPFAFFAWLAHVPLKLAERIRSSLSADKRSPKGLGLEGIRGASYALDVPAKQNRLLSAPPAFLILIITC